MLTTTTNQKIQLVQENCSTSDASDILDALIHQIINFHKIKALQLWESNHSCNSGFIDKKIQAIERAKEKAIDLLAQAKREGINVHITGHIEVSISKPAERPIIFNFIDN